MSISDGNIDLIKVALQNIREEYSWENLRMCELGNQKILTGDDGEEISIGSAKSHFTKRGVNHISFDLNGKGGSLPLDLSKPIDEKWYGYFDMVTNYGTTEHVENQFQVWKNIHDMLRIGGAIVSSIPLIGYWPKHCPYRYSSEFPIIFAEDNNYDICCIDIQVRHKINKLLNFVLIKKSEFFQDENTFGKGIQFTKNYNKNRDNLF